MTRFSFGHFVKVSAFSVFFFPVLWVICQVVLLVLWKNRTKLCPHSKDSTNMLL